MKYRLYVALDLAATVFFCLFVNWWAPLFCDKNGWLPTWLDWAQTFDNSLDSTVTGPGYWGRVKWLYRNPAYGFSYWVLGVPFNPEEWKVWVHTGSEETKDLYFYAVGPNGQFNEHYYRDGEHVKRGWKAWNMWDAEKKQWKTEPWGPQWRIPFVFSISFYD